MRLLFLELSDAKSYKAVLIIGHIHHVKVLAQELLNRFHLDPGDDLALGYACLADLTLFPEHVRESGISWLDRYTAIFDCHLLLVDEEGDHSGNIDLTPAIGNSLIAALYVKHRSG